MATISTPKANLSLKVPFEVKEELQEIAKEKNRSVHFLLIEAVEHYLEEQKAEREYQKWVEQKVMAAYNRLEKEGSQGINSTETNARIMAKVQKHLSGK